MKRALPDVLAAIEPVEGWLTEEQAARLHRCAAAVPEGGTIVELGSFRGRSTIVLASGAGAGVEVVAVDPYAGNDRGPGEWQGRDAEASADLAAFTRNLAAAGVADAVRHIRLPSSAAASQIKGELDLVYVDAAHRYGPCRLDLILWGGRVRPGGRMLVHDAFASVGVTLAILRRLVLGSDYVYAGRTRSLAEYRRAEAPLAGRARAANAARQLAQLPWFVRNLAIKLALSARLKPVARALGDEHWPY